MTAFHSSIPPRVSEAERAEMRSKAEAATPGPWFQGGSPWFSTGDCVLAGSEDGNIGVIIVDTRPIGCGRDEYEGPFETAEAEADATHIACACPKRTLDLLADIDDRDATIIRLTAALASAEERGKRIGFAEGVNAAAVLVAKEENAERHSAGPYAEGLTDMARQLFHLITALTPEPSDAG